MACATMDYPDFGIYLAARPTSNKKTPLWGMRCEVLIWLITEVAGVQLWMWLDDWLKMGRAVLRTIYI